MIDYQFVIFMSNESSHTWLRVFAQVKFPGLLQNPILKTNAFLNLHRIAS